MWAWWAWLPVGLQILDLRTKCMAWLGDDQTPIGDTAARNSVGTPQTPFSAQAASQVVEIYPTSTCREGAAPV